MDFLNINISSDNIISYEDEIYMNTYIFSIPLILFSLVIINQYLKISKYILPEHLDYLDIE